MPYFTLQQLSGDNLSLRKTGTEGFEFNSPSDPFAGTPVADRWSSTPSETGLERSGFDVPDGMMIESPGGSSAVHHHWTGGFYGAGGVSPGIYGNSSPHEVYGQMGGMYAKGTPPSFQYYASPPRRISRTEGYDDGIARMGPIPDEGVADLNPPADEKEAIEGYVPPGGRRKKKVSITIPEDPTVENFSLPDGLTSFEKKSVRHPLIFLLALMLIGITLALWNSAVSTGLSGNSAVRQAGGAFLMSLVTVGLLSWLI